VEGAAGVAELKCVELDGDELEDDCPPAEDDDEEAPPVPPPPPPPPEPPPDCASAAAALAMAKATANTIGTALLITSLRR
jgi:hypothetical protein